MTIKSISCSITLVFLTAAVGRGLAPHGISITFSETPKTSAKSVPDKNSFRQGKIVLDFLSLWLDFSFKNEA